MKRIKQHFYSKLALSCMLLATPTLVLASQATAMQAQSSTSNQVAVENQVEQRVNSPYLTVEKLNTFSKLHDVKVSPDQKWLVYGVKAYDDEGKKASDNLYLRDLTKQTPSIAKLTSNQSSEHSVQWSSDSQSLYFLADRTGSTQVWKLNLSGGEAEQVTDLPLDVEGLILSPDNKQLALAMSVLPSCKTLACTTKHKEDKSKQKHSGQVYDQLFVRHWDTWKDDLRTHVFVASLAPLSSNKKITEAVDLQQGWNTDIPAKPFSGMEEVAFTPDSKNIVFSAKKPDNQQPMHTNFDLYQVSIEGGDAVNLTTENKAWDSHPMFSKDGRFMAYAAMKEEVYESDRFAIMLKDLKTGVTKEVSPLWDRSVISMTFAADNRTLYVTAQDIGQRSIYEISTNFGDVRKVYSSGYASDVQLVGDSLLFTKHSLSHPKDVYMISREGNNIRQITDVNKDKLDNIKFGEYQQFNFKGWNDETVYGYWLKPANYQAGKKYPVAFLVHGGPQGSFGNMFHFRWNAQLWAAKGYGVVMIDFHGSTGYGKAFTDSISRDWGGKPLEDLKKGFQHITQAEPWLDANNACALGASYGGYMMNWIAGNWSDGFKCLVNHAGLFDMNSFYNTTEELWFPEHDMGGPVFDGSEDYTKFNPANYVNNWKTPMLVIQGLKDYRVPYAQSLAAFTTLQRKGVPSKLVVYPDENHWILNKENLKHWYGEVFSWMDTYLKPESE
nr:S9 family peptidase [Flocculibacter collagenilyticus]